MYHVPWIVSESFEKWNWLSLIILFGFSLLQKYRMWITYMTSGLKFCYVWAARCIIQLFIQPPWIQPRLVFWYGSYSKKIMTIMKFHNFWPAREHGLSKISERRLGWGRRKSDAHSTWSSDALNHTIETWFRSIHIRNIWDSLILFFGKSFFQSQWA